MKFALSISGGGLRGIVAARYAMEIEERNPGVHWDLIGGTSTGAIIALALGAPVPMKAKDLLSWYLNEGPKIFRSFFGVAGQVFDSKYSASPLYQSLQKVIGCHYMRLNSTLVTCATVEADHIRPVWLDNGSANWQAWEVAAASSSAETYFPAFKKDGSRYIDGGNFANCPARHVAFTAKRLWPNEEVTLVHLGTGNEYDPQPAPDGGILAWARTLPTDMFALQDFESQRDADQLVKNYFPLDITMKRLPAMDDASAETLKGYVSAVEQLIKYRPDVWKDLSAALESNVLLSK